MTTSRKEAMNLEDKSLAEQIGLDQHIRYTPGVGFYTWDGTRWKRDYENGLMTLGLVGDWLHDHGQLANLHPMRKLRETMTAVDALRVTADRWDANPEHFGFADGVWDLRSMTNLGHDPALMVTMQSPYSPDICDGPKLIDRCPGYWQHLRELCDWDDDLLRLLSNRSGQWLTGYTSPQDILILEGEGGRGKSVWVNIVAAIMGPDYAGAAPRGLLTLSDHSYSNDDYAIADIRGRRLLVQSETARNTQLNEELLKSLTGGDELRGRAAYAREHASYRPQSKCLLLTNYSVRLRSLGKDMERRLTVVRLTYEQPMGPVELERFRRITTTEGNQVAALLLYCAHAWLNMSEADRQWLPQRVLDARAATMAENDTVDAWLQESVEKAEGYNLAASTVISEYRAWAEANGYKPLSAGSLKRELERLGIHQTRRAAGNFYLNRKLREAE